MKNIYKTLPIAVSVLAVSLSSPAAIADERELHEYVPVLESVLKAALPANPDSGIYSQELSNGVHVVSDGKRYTRACRNDRRLHERCV